MNTLFVVTGGSGSGKSTIMKALMDNELVSVTTRSPRPNEVDGVDYHFITPSQYQELYERDELAEWSEYGGHGYNYGLTKEELEEKLSVADAFVISDYNGMLQFKEAYTKVVTIFIIASKEDADIQMRIRGENQEFIQKRLSTYDAELSNATYYDNVVINKHGSLKETIEEVRQMIQG